MPQFAMLTIGSKLHMKLLNVVKIFIRANDRSDLAVLHPGWRGVLLPVESTSLFCIEPQLIRFNRSVHKKLTRS